MTQKYSRQSCWIDKLEISISRVFSIECRLALNWVKSRGYTWLSLSLRLNRQINWLRNKRNITAEFTYIGHRILKGLNHHQLKMPVWMMKWYTEVTTLDKGIQWNPFWEATLMRGQPCLERPLVNVNLNMNVLIFSSLTRGHPSWKATFLNRHTHSPRTNARWPWLIMLWQLVS